MSLRRSIRSIVRLFRRDVEPDLDALQELIGYSFDNLDLLRLSLTHRSIVRVDDNYPISNERLEFLGDSVLGVVIAEALFKDNPELSEGDLTKTKAMLVNETTLATVSIEVGINNFIILSPEEIKASGHERPSIVADAFEALIGAVFLDGGLRPARKLVLSTIYARRDVITTDESQRNFKGELLEYFQARGNGLPRYETISEEGPDHDKRFHIVVTYDGDSLGEGIGTSKKDAEQKAASMALHNLNDE